MIGAETDSRALALEMGLTDGEFDAIRLGLGRDPNRIEVGIFAGMWSEHSSYKSTRALLSTLPRDGARVLAGPGSHAGCVDVGEGWAVAFKIESHNHPSAVEPYQGAATGIGGILRDIVAQGARPTAVMDSLCFGDPAAGHTRWLVEGIVDGIAGYGNSYGVANVGGKTVYDDRYGGNPLVNALAAGLVRHDEMRTAAARGTGNAVIYVGARTGRDGILGAAFASEELDPDHTSRRSHVQVGDPFTGKKLMEAVLSYGPGRGLVACQDMGAVGITCAATEMAAAGEVGLDIDLDLVPLREPDLDTWDILLSESQERFLLVVEHDREEEALAHFRHHGVHAAVIGRVARPPFVTVHHRGAVVAEVPAALVADGTPESGWHAGSLPAPEPYPDRPAPVDLEGVLCDILSHPNVSGTVDLWSRYDSTVGNRTVRGPGEADAAVLRLPGSNAGYGLAIEGRGDLCAIDPYLGTMAAIGTSRVRLACAGADMVAVTDGINHGSPSDPVEYRRLVQVVGGLGDGLRRLGIPVTGGNVSLYNESSHGAVPPTPMIGSLGTVADVRRVPHRRVSPGDALLLLGAMPDSRVASLYGRYLTGSIEGDPPAVDLEADDAVARLVLDLVADGIVRAAKAVAIGGTAVSIAKLCIRSGLGARIEVEAAPASRSDWALFGEYPGRVWLGVEPQHVPTVRAEAAASGIPVSASGLAGGDRLIIGDMLDVDVTKLTESFGKIDP